MKKILLATFILFSSAFCFAEATPEQVAAVGAQLRLPLRDIAIQLESPKWSFFMGVGFCDSQTGELVTLGISNSEQCLSVAYRSPETVEAAARFLGGNPVKVDGVWIVIRTHDDVGIGSVSVHN